MIEYFVVASLLIQMAVIVYAGKDYLLRIAMKYLILATLLLSSTSVIAANHHLHGMHIPIDHTMRQIGVPIPIDPVPVGRHHWHHFPWRHHWHHFPWRHHWHHFPILTTCMNGNGMCRVNIDPLPITEN
jgi:hypothetical protein